MRDHKEIIQLADSEVILHAARLLQAGELVAFPTETVYGLGADAQNESAIQRLYAAKGRPFNHPVIVHIENVDKVSTWAENIPAAAYQLAQAFWPGPLTIILQKKPNISTSLTGGQQSIGVRVPEHPTAQALLHAFGGGIAAPSANRFGRISPTTAQAVFEEFDSDIPLILDGGACAVGVESTIIDLISEVPTILRPGMITHDAIAEVLHTQVWETQQSSIRVSGALPRHYAPTTKALLLTYDEILETLPCLSVDALPVAVISWRVSPGRWLGVQWKQLPANAFDYARELYACLRTLDNGHYQVIFIETVPIGSEWSALRDRVQRATK